MTDSKDRKTGYIGASNDVLEGLISNLIEKRFVSAEVVDEELQTVREEIEESANTVIETAEPLSPEQAELRLEPYNAQYEKLGNDMKNKCSWEELMGRLLANDGRYLGLAEGLNEGGILFGVDVDGNPLFADDGLEPILTGMKYGETRNRVLFEHDGAKMIKINGKKVRTGYVMFPYSGTYNKSPEMIMFESFTGRPLIKSPKGDEWRSSWLESGACPSLPRDASFEPAYGTVRVNEAYAPVYNSKRGVRRLLRVKKIRTTQEQCEGDYQAKQK